MKNLYFLLLMALSLGASAQVVTADPAVGAMNIQDNATGANRSSTVTNLPVALKVPIFNLSPYNAIPNNSTTIIIGLGSRLALDPSFNLATARLSNYFTFTYNTSASQPRIIGTQKAVIPKDFIDSTSFQVYGTSLGSSAASVNFSINAGGNVDDEDGNNNSSSISYTVIATVLPVNLSQFTAVRTGCSIDVSFATEQEINVSRYEVEVSKDGNSFTKLSEITARNAGKYNSSYTITEDIKSPSLYVRLKSVDKDGRAVYSAVRKISGTCDLKNTFVLSAYPNPVKFEKTLNIISKEASFNGRYTVRLLDANGRTLLVKDMQLNNVSNFKLDIGSITAGQYLLKVTNADETESALVRFQKQ